MFRGANYMTYGLQTIYLGGVNRMVLSLTEMILGAHRSHRLHRFFIRMGKCICHTEITETTEISIRMGPRSPFRAFRDFCVTISNAQPICVICGICVTFKQEVHEVDLAAFLLGGGMLLQQGRDGYGRRVLPERLLHDELGGIVPRLERLAVRVGVGEENDLSASQRTEFVCLDVAQAASGQPHMLWEVFAENDCRLLALDNSNILFQQRIERITRILKQVSAEETMAGGHSLRICPAVAAAEQGADPRWVTLLVAVAVLTIVHHLAVVDVAIGSDLPEDDAALACAPQSVAADCTNHLLLRKIARIDYGLAELAFRRQRLEPHRGDDDQTAFEHLDLQAKLAA